MGVGEESHQLQEMNPCSWPSQGAKSTELRELAWHLGWETLNSHQEVRWLLVREAPSSESGLSSGVRWAGWELRSQAKEESACSEQLWPCLCQSLAVGSP